jgi:PAS domain S-box-containing protein
MRESDDLRQFRPTPPTKDGAMRMLAELEDVARRERSRLADALHDDVLQLVALARQDVLEWPDDGEHRLVLLELLDEIRQALRAIVTSTDEASLDDLPLGESLERIGNAAAARAGFAVTVTATEDADGVHDSAIRGWVRELVANVAKHAEARRVLIDVRAVEDDLVVTVRDDGGGLDAAALRVASEGGHVGLRRLERAAELLDGSFTIAREGAETVARVRVPRASLVHQRRTEDELGAERRWSAGLVAALRDALMVVRGDEVVQVNSALARLTGYGPASLTGTAVDDLPFWPAAERQANGRRLAGLLGHPDRDAVVPMTRADGTTFNALLTAQRVDDGVGGQVGWLVGIRDLTEQEQALERNRLRAEIASTVTTARRLSGILEAARKGPAAMFTAVGELLSGHLGWIDVVVNVRRGDLWVVEWTSCSEAASLLGQRYSDDDLRPLLDPRFDRGGVFVSYEEDGVEVDGLTVVVGARGASSPNSMKADDTLLLPVVDGAGRPRAIISVDRPRTGLRPTDAELQALAAIASHIGIAFELLDAAG